MKGSIRERSPGHWAIIIDVNDNGKRRRKWHSHVGNKRSAQAECNRLLAAHQSGAVNAAPARLTVAAFLERWLSHMATQASPATLVRYTSIVRSNLNPLLGGTALNRLQAEQIAQALAKMIADGLSPSSAGLARKVLRQACEQATRWGLITRNPVSLTDAPKVEKRRMSVLDENAMVSLLERTRGTDLYIPCLLAIATGMRRGEIAALLWRSVNLSTGKLLVVASMEQIGRAIREKETKTGRERCIILPAYAIEELRLHKRQQAETLLALGIRHGDDGHVCTRDGKPWTPIAMTLAFRSLLEGTGIRRLHDLRHSHATALLSAGVNLKVASERLGHSNIAMTADLYSHVSDTMQADAASRIDATMRAAFQRQGK
jgi:integrase